jgi:hypothetical protein
MKKMTNEQMEMIQGGSDYCDNMWMLLTGGGFQGDADLLMDAWGHYAEHCVD